jgi:two-component system response regulator YesN
MIIDDEESARKLMRALINWEEFGMEVAGEAASGVEAINTIDDIKPDIVFADISMPFMNGLEFTKLATDRYPELIIIIMTAFDEFEYARKCISMPVFDYMVKPMVRAEIEEALKRAVERLKNSKDFWEEQKKYSGSEMDEESNSIELIKRYVEENYSDSGINLAQVAAEFGFSSSYLSRKFKQDIGMNFVEYLTELRMKKAIEMAKDNVKMFKTASEVGIPDPNYFSRCFKKYTGKSYSDYATCRSKS